MEQVFGILGMHVVDRRRAQSPTSTFHTGEIARTVDVAKYIHIYILIRPAAYLLPPLKWTQIFIFFNVSSPVLYLQLQYLKQQKRILESIFQEFNMNYVDFSYFYSYNECMKQVPYTYTQAFYAGRLFHEGANQSVTRRRESYADRRHPS